MATLNKHDTVNNPILQNKLDKNGYLTIYHGHCKPTLRNSNSWTLNKDIATWFGNRNALFYRNNTYYLVTGKVRLDDVIAYITDRNEQEVVALNKNVKRKSKEFFTFNEDFSKPDCLVDDLEIKILSGKL